MLRRGRESTLYQKSPASSSVMYDPSGLSTTQGTHGFEYDEEFCPMEDSDTKTEVCEVPEDRAIEIRTVQYRTPSPVAGPSSQSDGFSVEKRKPVPDDIRMKKTKKGVVVKVDPIRARRPDGYSSESSDDSINNQFVDAQMMSMGIYPKKNRSGFRRF